MWKRPLCVEAYAHTLTSPPAHMFQISRFDDLPCKCRRHSFIVWLCLWNFQFVDWIHFTFCMFVSHFIMSPKMDSSSIRWIKLQMMEEITKETFMKSSLLRCTRFLCKKKEEREKCKRKGRKKRPKVKSFSLGDLIFFIFFFRRKRNIFRQTKEREKERERDKHLSDACSRKAEIFVWWEQVLSTVAQTFLIK